MRIVVTGGCGFIGSSFVHLCKERGYDILVVDKCTYAGNISNLPGTLDVFDILIKDICDVTPSDLGEYDYLVNFAAESHVDNSIKNPGIFIETNIANEQITSDNEVIILSNYDYAEVGQSQYSYFLS